GGVARSAGVVAFQFPHHPSATVTSPLPLLRRRGALSTFPSSSRRGGAKRRGGGVSVPPPPLGAGHVAAAPPSQGGSALHFPRLVAAGWREAPGWCGARRPTHPVRCPLFTARAPCTSRCAGRCRCPARGSTRTASRPGTPMRL